jgi:hypothetical protein
MRQSPAKFGNGLGPSRPIQVGNMIVNLNKSGLNASSGATQLEEGEAAQAIDVRFVGGGVGNDFGVSAFGTPYAGGGFKRVVAIANYEKFGVNRFLMRLRDVSWDRWNGVNWLTLGGALTGAPQDRYYTVVAKDKFLAANLVDRIKAWDGVDANAVADLSADAPIAKFITKIGTRILAAHVKVGGIVNPNLVAWCADGLITDWTTVNLGAGSAEPPVEGSNRTANYITGLSTLERGAVIYRQRSIQLATLTGIGAAPFRFATVDFTHGTESPYSIANGGLLNGDYFLGYDYMVYNFDGQACNPVGLPIYEYLREGIADRSRVVGAFDEANQEYYIAYPVTGSEILTECFVFNVREYARTQRLVWRRKNLPANTTSFGYGFLGTSSDPIVDTITQIVDTISTRVNDWGNIFGVDRVLFGDDNGQIWQLDYSTFATLGRFESKNFLFDGQEITVDRIRLHYRARTLSTVAVAVSTDAGLTWQAEKVYTMMPSGNGDGYAADDHRITGRQVMFRLRPLSGYFTVTEIEATLHPRGRGNA